MRPSERMAEGRTANGVLEGEVGAKVGGQLGGQVEGQVEGQVCLSDDMMYKLSKKIAQLTKVPYDALHSTEVVFVFVFVFYRSILSSAFILVILLLLPSPNDALIPWFR